MCVLRGNWIVEPAPPMSAARGPCAFSCDGRTSASPNPRARFPATDALLRAFKHQACGGVRHSDMGAY